MTALDAHRDLGPCPECEEAGREGGRLHSREGVNTKTGEVIEYAACSLGCGFMGKMYAGGLALTMTCDACEEEMDQIIGSDGSKAWECTTKGCAKRGRHVANREWELVEPPLCLECLKPMRFFRKTQTRQYFWACFDHKCFRDADKWGRVIHRRPGRSKGGKAL